MTYASELKNESASNIFVKMYFKNNVSGTVTSDGSFRDIPFTYGEVTNVYSTSSGSIVTLTPESTRAGVGAGEYYFDADLGKVTVHSSNYSNRASIIIEYVLYLSTKHLNGPKNLLTWSGGDVYWEDLISGVGDIPTSDISSADGFLPNISGSITLNNASHEFDFHFSKSSCINGTIEIYHALTESFEDNVATLFIGKVSGASSSGEGVTVTYFSSIKELDGTFRYAKSPSSPNVFTVGNYAKLDPSFSNAPMRVVYGYVDGVRAVGIEFNADTQASYTTVENHDYAVCKHFGGLNDSDITCTITNIVSSSTTSVGTDQTTTYVVDVNDATGINQFDNVFKSPFNNTNDAGWVVRARSGNRLTIDLLKNSGHAKTTTWSVGNVLRRTRIASLRLANKNKSGSIAVHMDRPPTLNTTTKMLEIYVVTEKYVGSPFVVHEIEQFCEPNDFFDDPSNLIFYCGVYGEKETVTLSGSTYSTKLSQFGVTSRWYEVLYAYLRNEVGMAESKIDATQLLALRNNEVGDEINIGLAIPEDYNGQLPTHREVIGNIMHSALGLAGFKTSGKIYIDRVRDLTGYDIEIFESDIIDGSFSYRSEPGELLTTIGLLANPDDLRPEVFNFPLRYVNTYQTDINLVSLNNIQKTVEMLSYATTDSNFLARTRRLYYDGYPRFYLTLSVGLDFYDIEVGDRVRLTRPSLPGFEYNSSGNSKNYRVVAISRNRNKINLTLFDSEGVNQHATSY